MYFTSHGTSFYYEKYGNEKEDALVIFPGWGDTSKTFRFLVTELAKEKTVYIVDYPGFGQSPPLSKDFTIYDYALLMKDFLEQEELLSPVLLGHSFGGRIITLLLGYYHYDCKKAILIDSAGILPKKSFLGKIKGLLYRTLKKGALFLSQAKKNKYLEWLIQKFASEDYKNLKANMRKTFSQVVSEDLFPYLKDITASTLLLWGEKDKATPLKDGQKIEKAIPDSALITFPDAAHFPYLEEPYTVLHIIQSFIKKED